MPSDGLASVAREGARLATLRALRDMLAADLDACESMRDKAALSQRLLDTLEQIEAVEKAAPERKGTALDEFTRRRLEPSAAPRQSRTAKRK